MALDFALRTWNSHYENSRKADYTKLTIDSNSKQFIFPFPVHTGFAKITNKGEQSKISRPENYTQFKMLFTGKEGIIAQWKNSTHLKIKKTPHDFNKDNLSENYEYKFSKEDIINSLTKDSSCFQYGDPKENNQIYFWDGVGKFIYDGEEIDTNNSTIKVHKELTLDEAINEAKKGLGKIYVVDLTKINQALELKYKKEYTKGEHWKGQLTNIEYGGSFGSSNASNVLGGYVDFQAVRDYTILTTHQVSETEQFFFYIVPIYNQRTQMSENIIMFIKSCTPYVDSNNNFIYNEIVFSSLNDHIESSGQAIQQFVNFGAPGEGYAFPKLITNENGEVIDFELDQEKLKDIGVRAVQLEFLGPAGVTSPIIQGRPIDNLNEPANPIRPTRDLWVEDMEYPLISSLNKQSAPSTVFYLTNMIPEIVTYFDNWQKAFQSNYMDAIKKNYEGVYESDYDSTVATNTNQKAICDSAFNLSGAKVVDKNFITRANNGFVYESQQDISNGKLRPAIGNENINLAKTKRGKPYDIMNLARYMFQTVPVVPMSIKEVVPWTWQSIPGIGGFLNKLMLGVPLGWRSVREYSDLLFPNIQTGIPMFIASDLYEYCSKAIWGSNSVGKGRLPLDIFRQGTNDEVGGIINSSSMSTAFIFKLTDKVVVDKWDINERKKIGQQEISTLMLGQKDFINKKDVAFTLGQDSYSIPPVMDFKDLVTDSVGSEKYIIDNIGFIAHAKCDVRITCFSKDPDESVDPMNDIVWQTTLQTSSKFNNQTRQQITIFNTSYLNEFIEDDAIFDNSPLRTLPEPQPTIPFKNISIDLNDIKWNIYKETEEQLKENIFKDFLVYDFKVLGFKTIKEAQQIYNDMDLNVIFNATSSFYKDEPSPSGEIQKKIKVLNGTKTKLSNISEQRQILIKDSINNTGTIDGEKSNLNFGYGFFTKGTELYLTINYDYDIKGWYKRIHGEGFDITYRGSARTKGDFTGVKLSITKKIQ